MKITIKCYECNGQNLILKSFGEDTIVFECKDCRSFTEVEEEKIIFAIETINK